MEFQEMNDSFFFSSRRRHTRFDCDWSSDVCSSDLNARSLREETSARNSWSSDLGRVSEKAWIVAFRYGSVCFTSPISKRFLPWMITVRSEERRVGKSVDLGGRRIIKKKKKRDR